MPPEEELAACTPPALSRELPTTGPVPLGEQTRWNSCGGEGGEQALPPVAPNAERNEENDAGMLQFPSKNPGDLPCEDRSREGQLEPGHQI
jgi:hypothetical protein